MAKGDVYTELPSGGTVYNGRGRPKKTDFTELSGGFEQLGDYDFEGTGHNAKKAQRPSRNFGLGSYGRVRMEEGGSRVRSGHIIFKKGIRYKDLAPFYRDMFLKFLKDTGEVPEEDETTNMMIRTNMMDLENNRKPEGYNRYGNMRLIFPITNGGSMCFYVYGLERSTLTRKVVVNLSKFLRKRGFDHQVRWDEMVLDEYRKKGR